MTEAVYLVVVTDPLDGSLEMSISKRPEVEDGSEELEEFYEEYSNNWNLVSIIKVTKENKDKILDQLLGAFNGIKEEVKG